MAETSRAPHPSSVTLPVLADPPATVLAFLEARFPRVGPGVWAARMAAGLVRDGADAAVTPATPYAAHAVIRYFREVPSETPVPFEEAIVYADARLVAADKPHFLPVTPGGAHVNECLLYRLRRRLDAPELAPLHRLDRETAGLVLLVRAAADRERYHRLFREGRVAKRYEALAGLPAERSRTEWEVANRIEPDVHWFRSRIVDGPVNARTRIRLLETRGPVGRYALEPFTGKRHQLRLHLAAIGAPILNDWLYPALQPEPKAGFERPLQLLAAELQLDDPFTGRPLAFRSTRTLAWDQRPLAGI